MRAWAVSAIILLAGSLGYYYSTASAQIASLKSVDSTVCSDNLVAVNAEQLIFSNTSQTLQQQIKEDNAMIMTLNSTRPSGYAGTMGILQSEISQDTIIVNLIIVIRSTFVVNEFLGPSPGIACPSLPE